MLNLQPLLKQLSIKGKDSVLRPLDVNFVDPNPDIGDFGWAQRPFVAEVERQYNSGKPVRIITLKARQLGISTVTEAILFLWNFIHPRTNGLVLSRETIASQELFSMIKLFWETWPMAKAYNLKYGTKQQMTWDNLSQLRVATANNLGTGRGSTLQAIHASEAAFYSDPATLFTGLNQTLPHRHGTIVVYESTANGVGNWFYEEWQKAELGETDFVPLFFPWFKHSEYRMHTTLTVKSELDPDERHLLKLGADMQSIAWRRWAIPNKANGDINYFMQEYPSTAEEAFITSGSPIFAHQYLNKCYVPVSGVRGMLIDEVNGGVRFVRDPSGPLTIFKAARDGDRRQDRYFVAGDPTESVGGDPACIQVLNRQTYEQVAVWHGRINPVHFAYEMIRIGKFYNWATICPEVGTWGGGSATIATLISKGYPSIWQHHSPDRVGNKHAAYGWMSNSSRKGWAIGDLQRFIVDQAIILHDKRTYQQLRNYVQRDDGSWGNADPDIHDDAVMALAIAVTASRTDGPFMTDSGLDKPNPILDLYQQQWDENSPSTMYDQFGA